MEAKRARFLLALIHAEQKKPEEAIKLLEPLIKNYDDVEDYIRFHLIQAQAQAGKHKKARENALANSFKHSPEHPSLSQKFS